ncbi:E3 ubiquitin-protein ligase bre1 [Xylographa soralifera]|nr:E3 ubiquitin-protein ligase bre1 [Xylographa soralifera]
MTLVEVRSVPLSSSGLVKMEERKRPASYENDDVAPPHKKQVTTTINGGSKSHQDADMPGKDDLEKFQKEAIYRQMQEYKRERNTLESRLNDLAKRAAYHDDHLRTIDSWFMQLLDEVKLAAGKLESGAPYSAFPSALLSAETPAFDKYLKSRSEAISSAISQIFAQSPVTTPQISNLQTRITQLLSIEKKHVNELEKSRLEREQTEERLETASMRYMVAEKKLDRAKSLTVAKLERQAIAGGRNEAGSGLGGVDGANKNDLPNGQGESSENLVEAETARKEAVATSEKQKEQIEQLATENEKLLSQVTLLTSKLSHLNDEDYARTDLFKHLKSQHEDVIKRINDLEATNHELRAEAEKLQAERTAYRIQLDTESQAAITEKELQLARAETDLNRIRAARDELQADVNTRKNAQGQERASFTQMKQLVAAKEDRIEALESEIDRLKITTSDNVATATADNISNEELRTKYSNIERQYSMLNGELASMGTAFKRASNSASQKTNHLSELEEKVMRLSAEKSRADQKYFAAMKAKDAREQEVRTLRAQNSKSSDIVSQLKDAEAATRALVVNLEKQLAETKEALTNLVKQHRTSQQQANEKSILVDGLKSQVDELKTSLTAKDGSLSVVSNTARKAEVEAEQLKARLDETKKNLDMWKTKGLGNQSGEYEMLRNLAICTVCRKNFKDTAVKTCGHVFCRECVEERLQSRMRKCPNCNKAFGANDHMRITL